MHDIPRCRYREWGERRRYGSRCMGVRLLGPFGMCSFYPYLVIQPGLLFLNRPTTQVWRSWILNFLLACIPMRSDAWRNDTPTFVTVSRSSSFKRLPSSFTMTSHLWMGFLQATMITLSLEFHGSSVYEGSFPREGWGRLKTNERMSARIIGVCFYARYLGNGQDDVMQLRTCSTF